ncbi:MAG: DUF1549 domain-containing protein [Planctomycetaceae bacterium]
MADPSQRTVQLTIILAVAIGGNLSGRDALQAQPPQDFAHSVAPILTQHCVPCHGGDQAKGSFSLNTRELLLGSEHVQAGDAASSLLVQLIRSDDAEVQMPPPEKARLTDAEIDRLSAWIDDGVEWEAGFTFAKTSWEPPLLPRSPDLPSSSTPDRRHPIDRILDQQLIAAGVAIPAGISDAEFLRRASLDLQGLLPDPDALQEFLQDRSANKRERVIRELLDDRIAWADHWMTFFNDLLRNDYSGTGFITGGRTQISGWLYESLLNNKPFDQFARELIAPAGTEQAGFINGIRWRGEVSAGQTVEIQFAQSVAQAFLGLNLKCASCHDSFIDRWTLNEAWGLAAVYSRRPLEIHRCDKPLGRQAQAAWLFPELGTIDSAASPEQRLQQLAELMTHPQNGRFTRTIVNRLWYSLMGRGIVHPLDAMQSPPWNADLLDHLAVHFSDNGYDLKETLYYIATSQAYQSQSITRSGPDETAAGYRGPVSRRMTAEQFVDSVWQLTGTAPAVIEAPVIRSFSDEDEAAIPLNAGWIWGSSAAAGRTPPSGEAISFRRIVELSELPERAVVLVTCDNAASLFINGHSVWRGTDWTKPGVVDVSGHLQTGDNTVLVTGENGGQGPNPAGLFLQLVLQYSADHQEFVGSDASWEWHPVSAGQAAVPADVPDDGWNSVEVVPALDVWQKAVQASGRSQLQQILRNSSVPAVRASLIKNNALMRALGRPHREQIVSMRPDELSTLEAIVLSNGDELAGWLREGAARLHSQAAEDPQQVIRRLSRFAWSRDPQPEELQLMDEHLRAGSSQQQLEDLLWAIIMSPEFLLIR